MALLIVVTLLAFVVILLVGLATLARVETSIAGNTQRQAQARENALLAMKVALAQLQLHAGPDQRVTATAETFTPAPAAEGEAPASVHAQKLRYTGVWPSDPAASADPKTPLAWLASGAETATPVDVTQAIPAARRVELVGARTAGTANSVVAELQDIQTTGVPGASPTTPSTIGRYAWWVGDQGVKAPVAVPDASVSVTAAPFDLADVRARIRQQMPLGAAATDANGAAIFEPRDGNNATPVNQQRVAATNQLAFLRRAGSNTQVGLTLVQQNFHAWSPNNFAVLANTKLGGLRQDLSLAPGLLGEAFAAWANYNAYMESFVAPPPTEESSGDSAATINNAPSILPAYGSDPLRRRYVMTPHTMNLQVGGSHQVAPIVTYFALTFNVRTSGTGSSQPLEVRAGWMVSLWNPYTGALVPEPLRLEIRGLPASVKVMNETSGTPTEIADFSLHSAYGSPLRISLPWDSQNTPEDAPAEDRASWLPGRVYTWRSVEDTTKAEIPADGFSSRFYTRSFVASGETNQGVQRAISAAPANGGDSCHLQVNGDFENLTVQLYAVRTDGPVRIGTFRSPNFVRSFVTASRSISSGTYQFAYVFRLKESTDTPATPGAWLTTENVDFRRSTVPEAAFVVGANGNSPEQYENTLTSLAISDPGRLLDRGGTSYSYNEDVPVFELPRAPILSIGALQHFRMVGSRPFMIGNPWGVNFELNNVPLGQLFDRFFFSGFADGVAATTSATGDLVPPNPLLKPLRKLDGSKPTLDDVRQTFMTPGTPETPEAPATPATPSAAEARSSKYFLQAGAFNLNSVNANAWAAVLRGVRFPTSAQAFSYLNASSSTGTAEDTATRTVQSTDAHFFRFPQSAQETYKAEAATIDPDDPDAITPANTHLFRQGMRTLTAEQVDALAEQIVTFVRRKHADSGPFRALEEFVSPSPLFAGSTTDADGNPIPLGPRSVLEAAIEEAGINASIAEFSSQWLTQADVMTALAPVLFARSDTFVIRTYGEVVNPATQAVEGRAWCEATVQRLPDYFDASLAAESMPSAFEPTPNPDDPEAPPTSTAAQEFNKRYGRRFKVVSFRWLTRADI